MILFFKKWSHSSLWITFITKNHICTIYKNHEVLDLKSVFKNCFQKHRLNNENYTCKSFIRKKEKEKEKEKIEKNTAWASVQDFTG